MPGPGVALPIEIRRPLGLEITVKQTNVKETKRAQYIVGSAILWASIFVATAVILHGTPFFAQLIGILGVGMVWSVIITPMVLSQDR